MKLLLSPHAGPHTSPLPCSVCLAAIARQFYPSIWSDIQVEFTQSLGTTTARDDAKVAGTAPGSPGATPTNAGTLLAGLGLLSLSDRRDVAQLCLISLGAVRPSNSHAANPVGLPSPLPARRPPTVLYTPAAVRLLAETAAAGVTLGPGARRRSGAEATAPLASGTATVVAAGLALHLAVTPPVIPDALLLSLISTIRHWLPSTLHALHHSASDRRAISLAALQILATSRGLLGREGARLLGSPEALPSVDLLREVAVAPSTSSWHWRYQVAAMQATSLAQGGLSPPRQAEATAGPTDRQRRDRLALLLTVLTRTREPAPLLTALAGIREVLTGVAGRTADRAVTAGLPGALVSIATQLVSRSLPPSCDRDGLPCPSLLQAVAEALAALAGTVTAAAQPTLCPSLLQFADILAGLLDEAKRNALHSLQVSLDLPTPPTTSRPFRVPGRLAVIAATYAGAVLASGTLSSTSPSPPPEFAQLTTVTASMATAIIRTRRAHPTFVSQLTADLVLEGLAALTGHVEATTVISVRDGIVDALERGRSTVALRLLLPLVTGDNVGALATKLISLGKAQARPDLLATAVDLLAEHAPSLAVIEPFFRDIIVSLDRYPASVRLSLTQHLMDAGSSDRAVATFLLNTLVRPRAAAAFAVPASVDAPEILLLLSYLQEAGNAPDDGRLLVVLGDALARAPILTRAQLSLATTLGSLASLWQSEHPDLARLAGEDGVIGRKKRELSEMLSYVGKYRQMYTATRDSE